MQIRVLPHRPRARKRAAPETIEVNLTHEAYATPNDASHSQQTWNLTGLLPEATGALVGHELGQEAQATKLFTYLVQNLI